jgi:hypothetical protein
MAAKYPGPVTLTGGGRVGVEKGGAAGVCVVGGPAAAGDGVFPDDARCLYAGEAGDAFGEALVETDHRFRGVGGFDEIEFDVKDTFGAEAGRLVSEAEEGLHQERGAD